MPLITVGELQVHAVSTHEGLAVNWCVHSGRMRDGLTQHYQASQWGLHKPTQNIRGSAGIHF